MGFRKLSKLRQEAVPLDYSHDILTSLGSSLSMRRLPEVRVSVEVSSPLLFGLFHPVILLPSGFYERSSPEELRLMLLHELFHWKHGDIRMLLFKRMVEAFFFFHPAVWYAGRIAVRASEQICDDAVVSFTGSSASYASCLLSISENAGNQSSYALAGLAVRDSAVGQRIKRILKEGYTMISMKAVLASVSVLILVSVLGLPTFLISAKAASGRGQIVFSRGMWQNENAESFFNIWVMDADGENEKQLTNSGKDTYPSWSPDGRRIAFLSTRDGRNEIYVMDSDGANVKRLTDMPDVHGFPSWSPDGEMISFVRKDGRGKIFTMDANGKKVEVLIDLPVWNYHRAQWSPDGKKIAFSNDPGNSNYSIWVADADGTNGEMVANVSEYDVKPAWSPDGKSIAFESNTTVNPQENLARIHVMDADGQNERVLAEGHDPCWSSDGKSIAFSWNWQIHIMDSDGKNPKQITNNALFDWLPDWWGDSTAVEPVNKLKATWGKMKRGLFSR